MLYAQRLFTKTAKTAAKAAGWVSGEGATTEVLVVLIEPLRPRTHPKVTVRAWRSIPELAVAISEDHRSLHGVIPLANISTAMRTLQSNWTRAAGCGELATG
jgi:hypothetical protein